MILFTAGFPYALFVFISFFTTPPKYHFRIAESFINSIDNKQVKDLFDVVFFFQIKFYNQFSRKIINTVLRY